MNVFVRKGDSLWYYSQLFAIPVQLIVDSNPSVDPTELTIGQKIRIPGFVTTAYTIKSGDTLWNVARSRNLPLDALLVANSSVNPNALQIGDTIQVPLRITWRLVNGKQRYTYDQMVNDLNRLVRVYPFLRRRSIGDSVLGESIPELLIGKGTKQVHYNAAFHANEWITTPVMMTFINDYALALTNSGSIRGLSVLPLYSQTTLSLVPMVNPDGVNLVLNGPPAQSPWKEDVVQINGGSRDFTGWKANIRGVDLNDQFPAKWEEERERNPKKPSPRDYGGEKPLTEPEAIAMAELTKSRNFERVLAFHTQGEVIYWGFEKMEPPEAKRIVEEFGRVSGYEPVQTIESYAGYKDWFIQDWKKPGYTVELGKGINPLPLSQFEEIYEETLGIFLAGLYM